MNTILDDHRMHCICRGNWMLIRNTTNYLQISDDVSQIVTQYLCSPVRLLDACSSLLQWLIPCIFFALPPHTRHPRPHTRFRLTTYTWTLHELTCDSRHDAAARTRV